MYNLVRSKHRFNSAAAHISDNDDDDGKEWEKANIFLLSIKINTQTQYNIMYTNRIFEKTCLYCSGSFIQNSS